MPHNKSHPAVDAAAGLAALAAAAGAYYFYGSKAAKTHRKQMKAWMVKAKADMIFELEQMKTLSQKGYEQTVSQVMEKYKKLEKASPKELEFLQKELKSNWKNIAKHLPKTAELKRATKTPAKKKVK